MSAPAGWDVAETGASPVEVEIGMRWKSLWRLAARPWVPLAFAQMVRPASNPGLRRSGLRLTAAGPALVQVWQDRDTLDDWSRDAGRSHLAPWQRFKQEADGTAAWGIWHRVQAL